MQKKFVEEKLKGKSSRRAALDAGYSENTATNANDNILERRGTMEYFQSKMKEAGITEDKVAQVLEEGLGATNLNGKDAIEHKDFKTRLDYAKYINELGGYQVIKKTDITSGGKSINDLFKNARQQSNLPNPKDNTVEK